MGGVFDINNCEGFIFKSEKETPNIPEINEILYFSIFFI